MASLASISLSIIFLSSSVLSPFSQHKAAKSSLDHKELYHLLKRQPRARLKKMYEAGLKALAWIHLLEKRALSLDRALRSPGQMLRRHVHFPKKEDVFDEASSSLYYYHTHRGQEKGHFHLFLMEEGMPLNSKALFSSSREESFSHLIAISLDNKGWPFKLFTTNQWVTGERWYKAEDVIGFTQKFHIQGEGDNWATSQCLSALVTFFGPQIEKLIIERDERLKKLTYEKNAETKTVLEDTHIEVLSEMLVDISTQLKLIQQLL